MEHSGLLHTLICSTWNSLCRIGNVPCGTERNVSIVPCGTEIMKNAEETVTNRFQINTLQNRD